MVSPDIHGGCVGCSWVEHCETSALTYCSGCSWMECLCVVCGCGQARCWVVGEQARTLVGCVVVVSFHCHGSRSLCWGWWFGCVVVVCFVNSGREHLAITLCVVVVILFVFVFLVLFVLSPHCMCRLSGLCVFVWGGECSRAHGGCLGIKGR